jgi:hypothetical protein
MTNMRGEEAYISTFIKLLITYTICMISQRYESTGDVVHVLSLLQMVNLMIKVSCAEKVGLPSTYAMAEIHLDTNYETTLLTMRKGNRRSFSNNLEHGL